MVIFKIRYYLRKGEEEEGGERSEEGEKEKEKEKVVHSTSWPMTPRHSPTGRYCYRDF